MKNPAQHLDDLLIGYPRLGEIVEMFISARGQEQFSDWPKWCFLPMAGWLEVIRTQSNALTATGGLNIARLAAIGAWRYSQGVYDFDEELYNALMSSVHNGRIPSELLKNLPEWCLYIPLQGEDVLFDKQVVVGFWVHLEFDVNTEQEELRFLFNTKDNGLLPAILHLGHEDIDSSLKSALDASMASLDESDDEVLQLLMESQKTQKAVIKKVLPLLLYLISEPPEEDEHIKLSSLKYPSFKKTKKGLRLFPAKGVKRWDIGREIGDKIRRERQQFFIGLGSHKAPHLRRGHWHGFWHGKGRSKYKVKWVRPTFVGGLEN